MALSSIGLHPSPLPTLESGEVHIWHAHLYLVSQSTQRLFSTLAPDERARAESFRFEKDRNRYGIARGILRSLLGGYLDADPGELEFSYGPFGKPFLSSVSPEPPLHFNVSHSHGLALFAFSRDQEIGIDLERIRPRFDFEHLAKSYFPPAELAELHSYGTAEKLAAFFRLWTRLESCAKARGVGLSLLDGASNESLPNAELGSKRVDDLLHREITKFKIHQFRPGHGFLAALAVTADEVRLHHYLYPEQMKIQC
jgi:4'-phosphopantetheinyl transferase